MTHDEIKRAAQLLEALTERDKSYQALKKATKLQVLATDERGNMLGRFDRTTRAEWTDDDARTLHGFLLRQSRLSREKIARELRQLNVSVPELML